VIADEPADEHVLSHVLLSHDGYSGIYLVKMRVAFNGRTYSCKSYFNDHFDTSVFLLPDYLEFIDWPEDAKADLPIVKDIADRFRRKVHARDRRRRDS
jgi:hypothetical protein